MGFFSWKTSDTNRSISNVYSGRGTFKVTMLMPNGEKFTENEYEGYGIFGGVDFYDAVYELNKDNPKFEHITSRDWENRSKGIYMLSHTEDNRHHAISPRLVEDDSLDWSDVDDSPTCQSQGYFF
jgi:hypothetical protein